MEQRHLPQAEGWRRQLRAGLRLLRDGLFEQAEDRFARAHAEAPDRPEVCYALGRERLRRGRVDEAESLLRAAWAGDPSLVSAAASLARCLALHQGRYAEAHAILDDAAARHGRVPQLDVVRSELLLDEGRIDAARAAAEAALAADASPTTCAAARAALARVFNQQGIDLATAGHSEPALFCFKRAADHDPDWSGPRVNMGAAFLGLGRRAAARAAFEAAVQIDGDNPLAHLNLGLLLHAERLPGAEVHLERALELDDELHEARAALAEIALSVGDADRACALLSERLERAPSDPAAWVDLGTALGQAGDRSGAEACFRQALELDGDNATACHRLADLLAREGRYLEAAVIAQRARTLDADVSSRSEDA